jgi:energy-coupling factor transporter ATP-binding protein EcfA2
MGSPSIEGLQLALLDGPLSVLCSDGTTGDPNGHAAMVLEAIEVDHARYIGRSQPLSVKFSPWLSAIIGGRGTGKSTLIEFLRLSLRRESDLPDELKPEFEKYGRVYPNREDGGLLTSETKIRAIYHKHGTRFRVQWSPDGSQHPIEEERDQAWVRAEGDIKQRFPVRICSQKEIFQLAKNSHALLNIVDATPEVDYISWREKWHEEESRYLALRAMVREIETGLAEEPRLRGELDDVKRKLSIFEQAGHSDVLKTYQRRRRQQQSIDAWERSWNGTGDRLRHVAANIVPDHLDETAFDGISAQELELREYAAKTRNQLDAVRMTIEASAIQAELICVNWRKTIEGSLWKAATDIAARAYQDLQAKLTQEGAGDTNAYGEYVQRRQTLEQRLKNMDDRKTQVAVILSQIEVILSRLLNLRRQITASRKQFLDQVLSDNKYVRIGVVPYGARETVETELRKLLQREGGGFEKDIGTPDTEGVLGELYKRVSSADDFEKRLADIKKWIRSKASNTDVSSDVADQRFAKHLAKLQPEALDRLDLWYPRDSLDVQYCTSGDRQCFRPIQEGSPGQKTAALLAFLLSYGEEPLILDQPEDDLDNHLIYDLIVMQLREVKRQRQVIVVTHNANIVVNGDAELVIALAVRGGQTQIESAGSLQEKSVRENICTIMEGGRTAFDQRYRRIALEGRHV